MYQLVNDIRDVPTEVMPQCLRSYLSVFAALHYTAELQDRAPLQAQSDIVFVGWRIQLQKTVSAGTGSRGVSCLSSLC